MVPRWHAARHQQSVDVLQVLSNNVCRGRDHVSDAQPLHARRAQPGPAACGRGRVRDESGPAGGRGRVCPRRRDRAVPRDRPARGHRAVPTRRGAGQHSHSGASLARPVGQPRRRDRVPPVVSPDHGVLGLPGTAHLGVGRPGGGRQRRARRRFHAGLADRGRTRLPAVDDACGGALATTEPRTGGGVGASTAVDGLRPRTPRPRHQVRRAVRHGHDGETGRLRRPGQHHHRRAHERCRRGHVRPAGPQVVLLRAPVRCFPGAGTGTGGAELLSGAAGSAWRRTQSVSGAAAQGQAGQQVQRVLRGGVRRHRRLDGRRAGPGRAHDHRDGRTHPARLRSRCGSRHAAGCGRGGVACPAPGGVRGDARGSAGDGRRPGRPAARVGGRHLDRCPARGCARFR